MNKSGGHIDQVISHVLTQGRGHERDRGFTCNAGHNIELNRHVNQSRIKFDLAEPDHWQTKKLGVDRRDLSIQACFSGAEGGIQRKQRFSAMAKSRFMAGSQPPFHEVSGNLPEINGGDGNILLSSDFESHFLNNGDIASMTI
jgi:hypothetical protein